MLQASIFIVPTIWRNKVGDAVGITMGRSGSRWHIDCKLVLPFSCGKSVTCDVFEDCASAVAVSQYCTGLALLGTNLYDLIFDIAVTYPYVVVCTFRYASSKAIQMKNRIGPFTTCEVRLLDVDPKLHPEGVL